MEDGDPLGSQPCPRDVISCPVLRTPFLGVKKHMTLAWGCLVPFLRLFLVGMGRERRLPSGGTYPDTDPTLMPAGLGDGQSTAQNPTDTDPVAPPSSPQLRRVTEHPAQLGQS